MKNLNGDGKLLQNKMLRLLIKQRNIGFVALFLQKHKHVGYFLKANLPLPHSFISIIIDIFDFLSVLLIFFISINSMMKVDSL